MSSNSKGKELHWHLVFVRTLNPIYKYCFGESLTFDPFAKEPKQQILSNNAIRELISYINTYYFEKKFIVIGWNIFKDKQ